MATAPKTGSVRWWIRFTLGPLPVRIAIVIAFSSLAVAVFSVTQLSSTVEKNGRLIAQQGRDRTAAVDANVRARYDDCAKVNKLRVGLRQIVTKTETQMSLVRQSFPQLPESYWRVQGAVYRRELSTFEDDDCHIYAIDALPDRRERARAEQRLP